MSNSPCGLSAISSSIGVSQSPMVGAGVSGVDSASPRFRPSRNHSGDGLAKGRETLWTVAAAALIATVATFGLLAVVLIVALARGAQLLFRKFKNKPAAFDGGWLPVHSTNLEEQGCEPLSTRTGRISA